MAVTYKHTHLNLREIDNCLISNRRIVNAITKQDLIKFQNPGNNKRAELYDLYKNTGNKRYVRKTRLIITYERKSRTKEEQFFELAKNWKVETSIYSIAVKKITNKNYMGIIGMGVTYGTPIVKLILEDFKKGVEYWHYALMSITKTNPVPKESITNLKKVREAWLAWGVKNKIIS